MRCPCYSALSPALERRVDDAGVSADRQRIFVAGQTTGEGRGVGGYCDQRGLKLSAAH